MTISLRAGIIAFTLLLVGAAVDSDARTIRVDRESESIEGSAFADDGSVRKDFYTLWETTSGVIERRPFSVNLFGTVYDSYFINENGIISFGAPVDLTPRDPIDVFNAGVPVIAPFFADADLTLGRSGNDPLGRRNGRVSLTSALGLTPTITMFVDFYSSHQGATAGQSPPTNIMQVAFIGVESTTDFRLELNYDILQWESGNLDGGVDGLGGLPPRVGFSDGFGRVYEIPGSGQNGVLLKPDLSQECDTGSLSVGCNDYFFNFRSGLPYFLDGTAVFAVSEPDDMALFLAALAVMAAIRRRQRLR